MPNLLAYLRLVRPANVITALADIIAGFIVANWLILHGSILTGADLPAMTALAWLLLSSLGLYAGGMVFNDVFDAELDRKERPERPIPRGLISVWQGTGFGLVLFSIGIAAAYQVTTTSFYLALLICVLCFSYDGYTKHSAWLGPINMGLCRGANLLLGASVIPGGLDSIGILGLIPTLFIAAVTAVSQGEVAGGNRTALSSAVILYLLTLVAVLGVIFYFNANLWSAVPFLGLFAWRVFMPLKAALHHPSPLQIRQAVKAGVMSLIILDAALSAGFSNWLVGILILLLLPLSGLLAKRFAVT